MRRAMRSMAKVARYGSSYCAPVPLSNAGCWTMDRLRQIFGRDIFSQDIFGQDIFGQDIFARDTGSKSSRNWSRVSMADLSNSLARGGPRRPSSFLASDRSPRQEPAKARTGNDKSR